MLGNITITKNNFEKICRTCLMSNENGNMTSIYETEVFNMLTSCSTINIQVDDGLPSQICSQCSNKIFESYEFKQQIERADQILRQAQLVNDDNASKWEINEKEDTEESNSSHDSIKIELNESRTNVSDDESDDLNDDDNDDDYNKLNAKTEIKKTNDNSFKEIDNKPSHSPLLQQEAYFYPAESDSETQKESAWERALMLGPEKCDPTTKTCKICNKVLYNVHSLVRHVETHNQNRQYEIVCPICHKGFYEKKHIKNHVLRHKGQARFKCDDCKKPFYELNALRAHVKKKHPEKEISCTECKEKFVLSQDLELHMKTHKEYQYFCSDCGKPFYHRYLLRKHQWMHAKERLFHCKQCEKSFKSKQVLHLHYKRCHSGEKKREICNICGKSVVYLKNHMYIHNDEKYKCLECPQEFTNKYSLEKHMKRKHGNMDETTLNPYLCNVCGKRSENLTMLNRHILTHSDVKTHKCHICGKLFKSIELVNSHVRYTHNNVRNFKCSICGKCFHTTSGLKLHMRTHTGERPYECDVCGKAFQQRSTLKTHMKVHGYPAVQKQQSNHSNKTVLNENLKLDQL